MRDFQPKPKRRVVEELPAELVTFLAEVAELIAAGAEQARIPSDDLLQAECAYGGLKDEGGDTFAFVYFPKAAARPDRNRPRWFLELTRTEIARAADRSLVAVPLWACADPACGSRFSSEDDSCFDCDCSDRVQGTLPEGGFATRRDWALAYFAANPGSEPLEMIGAYNGNTDLGPSLGYFTLDEAQRILAELAAGSR